MSSRVRVLGSLLLHQALRSRRPSLSSIFSFASVLSIGTPGGQGPKTNYRLFGVDFAIHWLIGSPNPLTFVTCAR